ncbi:hypothetical protein BH18ACT4_BH18ACT4_13070 [soil metagenome]
MLDGAKAMALTIVDLWLRPAALAEAKAAFDEATESRRWPLIPD